MHVLSTIVVKSSEFHGKRSITHEIVILECVLNGAFRLVGRTGIVYVATNGVVAPRTLAKTSAQVAAQFGADTDWFTCAEIDESSSLLRFSASYREYIAKNQLQ